MDVAARARLEIGDLRAQGSIVPEQLIGVLIRATGEGIGTAEVIDILEIIIPCPANERVAAAAVIVECVGAQAADHRIVSGLPVEIGVAGSTAVVERIIAIAAIERVRARAADDRVIAVFTDEVIIAGAGIAFDRIVPRAAIDRVVTVTASSVSSPPSP